MTPAFPTKGVTYETTRGTFKVHSTSPYGLTLERSDGRYVVVARSDWNTWQPTLVVDNPN